ncbi:MAG: peptidylprolyl isomerase [Flavobacteriaceae bacterium]|nr:peptidylprolyl isomerase [Flavobacteriaceae bacterium]
MNKTGIYANIETSKGSIEIQLTYDKTPVTVANFIGLAEGSIKNNHKPQGEAYYDGLTFHRVIADFMVQGGCPLGLGSGGPGYQFKDEFHPELRHDRPGVLSMANAGPGSNGSQFFITHVPTPWLDDNHSVFGFVTQGQEVVDAIVQGDIIKSISIEKIGASAKAFDAPSIFEAYQKTEQENTAQEATKRTKALDELAKDFTETPSGLRYKILKKGAGKKVEKGHQVSVHYTGKLTDGRVFDSSKSRNQSFSFYAGNGQVIAGWDEAVQLLKVGDQVEIVLPPELAYGSLGAGGIIPPNAILIFEIEVLDAR